MLEGIVRFVDVFDADLLQLYIASAVDLQQCLAFWHDPVKSLAAIQCANRFVAITRAQGRSASLGRGCRPDHSFLQSADKSFGIGRAAIARLCGVPSTDFFNPVGSLMHQHIALVVIGIGDGFTADTRRLVQQLPAGDGFSGQLAVIGLAGVRYASLDVVSGC